MILLFYKHEARPEKVLRRAQVHTRLRLTFVFFCLLELFRHLYPALKNASPFFQLLSPYHPSSWSQTRSVVRYRRARGRFQKVGSDMLVVVRKGI